MTPMTAEERIVRIETMLEEGFHRLFGNGQPGELDKIRTAVSDETGKLEARLRHIEAVASRSKGAIGAIVAIITLGGAVGIWQIFIR